MNVFRKMFLMIALAGVVMGLYAGTASAHTSAPAAASAHGQCGGPSANMNQLIGNLMGKGVLDDIGRMFNIQPVDDNVDNWIRRNVGYATMARTATFGNKGCSNGTFFGAHPRTLLPGDKAWVLTAQLKAKFPNGYSLTPRKGWTRKMVCVKVFDNPTCTNPLTGEACIWVWVPPTKKSVVPKPKVPVVNAPKPLCIDVHGQPLFALPPGNELQVINGNVVCVEQTQTQKQCNGNEVPIKNSQGVVIDCQQQQQQQTQTNNQTVTVVVNVPPAQCVAPNTMVNGVCTAPPTPTTSQSATVSNLTHLQNPTGVLAGNTYRICDDVSTSTQMTVIFSADSGSVSGGSSTVNGTQNVCASYTAPNDAVIAPDTYHVKVFYNGQLMAQDSWTVTVNPQPAG